ncbi:hypothetical protein [uncultured Friedmanniella sp.]|uniref:hypothetical protein n=1 Tax=uncultured Friedmanniella sp. TaxID=335381 RepID=UPI0035CC9621
MSVQDKVAEQIKRVPARRWIEYSARFGRDTQDVMTDAVMAIVVVLNEEHRRTHGEADIENLLDLGLSELEAKLQATFADKPGAEGATFPDGAAGGVEVGGVVADGRGAAVRGEPGPDLPVDGDSAV